MPQYLTPAQWKDSIGTAAAASSEMKLLCDILDALTNGNASRPTTALIELPITIGASDTVDLSSMQGKRINGLLGIDGSGMVYSLIALTGIIINTTNYKDRILLQAALDYANYLPNMLSNAPFIEENDNSITLDTGQIIKCYASITTY